MWGGREATWLVAPHWWPSAWSPMSSRARRANSFNLLEYTPQFTSGQQGGFDIRIVRSLLEEYDDFAVGTLPGIAALDSARPVSEMAATPGAANLDRIGHPNFPLRAGACRRIARPAGPHFAEGQAAHASPMVAVRDTVPRRSEDYR
jgi:hypothetical protein